MMIFIEAVSVLVHGIIWIILKGHTELHFSFSLGTNVFVQICFFMIMCYVSVSTCLLGELEV